jgi:hypothetical protein
MSSEVDRKQEEAWTALYRQIVRLLSHYGNNGIRERDDFFVVDENIGSLQQKIELNNIEFMRPEIIRLLQKLLVLFPGWEIVVGLSVPDESGHMRDMGLTIRRHEIVDDLQRRYLPEPYRGFRYEGSRLRTEDD